MSNLAREALAENRVVLSVMGAHAGEDETAIFSRKLRDIDCVGRTFWAYGSHAARPDLVQRAGSAFILFLAPSKNNGARPTTISRAATCFSAENKLWLPMPDGVGRVTGRLPAYALVLSELSLCSEELDVWTYACDNAPVRFRLGASTLLVERKDTSADPRRMASRVRRVIAVGRLETPRAVWIR